MLIVNRMPSLVLKTKENIHRRIYPNLCVETQNYVSIFNESRKKFIFIFPGLMSDNLDLQKMCKVLYEEFNETYNIIGIKYIQNYDSIKNLCAHTVKVVLMSLYQNVPSIDINNIRSQFKYCELHVIGKSYGCSIAIETFLQLQTKYGFPTLRSFICYKTFNTLTNVIKYSNNKIVDTCTRLFLPIIINNYMYNNTRIIYIKTKSINIVSHFNDEIINKRAQFSYAFCKLNNINLFYDTDKPDSSTSVSYYDYFFGCHTHFNRKLIANIIRSSNN